MRSTHIEVAILVAQCPSLSMVQWLSLPALFEQFSLDLSFTACRQEPKGSSHETKKLRMPESARQTGCMA